jgi:hypothetical protein
MASDTDAGSLHDIYADPDNRSEVDEMDTRK